MKNSKFGYLSGVILSGGAVLGSLWILGDPFLAVVFLFIEWIFLMLLLED